MTRLALLRQRHGSVIRWSGWMLLAGVLALGAYRQTLHWQVGHERSATDARLVSPVEVVAWTEQHATIPIIGTNGFYVEDGGMFALATSPLEQGETVAAMAVRVLDKGMEPSRIKELHSREFITYMRRAAMVAKGFEVPRVYESFARATNNYFE